MHDAPCRRSRNPLALAIIKRYAAIQTARQFQRDKGLNQNRFRLTHLVNLIKAVGPEVFFIEFKTLSDQEGREIAGVAKITIH